MNGFKILITLVLTWKVVFPCEADNVTTQSSETETSKPTSIQNYEPGNKTEQKCQEYEETLLYEEYKASRKLFRRPRAILGGRPALKLEFPHMAAIGFNASEGKIIWLCGGGLISARFVLTAAHCCFSSTWKNATVVRLGDQNLDSTDDDKYAKNYAIIERIKHPNYTSNTYYHDIALLKLERNVRFSSGIIPICLWLPDRQIPNSHAKTAGWGRLNWHDNNGSTFLVKVTLTLANNSYCNRIYADETHMLNQGIVSDWQICAGGHSKDTCPGDSGGLLFICNKQEHSLCTAIGITSVGKICEGSVPGVYTRVSHYVPWIEKIVWP